jgi:uncharacterized protein (TIGR00369 family)
MTDPAPDFTELMNATLGGWPAAMGLRFLRVGPDEVTAELEVGPQHLQPYGIVHGGVHCGVIETLASAGAAVVAMGRGQSVVGLENHTSFIRAVREGRLTATARPVTRGRTSQVWETSIADTDGRLVARGTVRLLCLTPETPLAGGTATVGHGSGE